MAGAPEGAVVDHGLRGTPPSGCIHNHDNSYTHTHNCAHNYTDTHNCTNTHRLCYSHCRLPGRRESGR